MLTIGIAMLVILVISGLVVAYVAYPHRGEDIPGAPWLGDAMAKANDRLPKFQDGDLDDVHARDETRPGHPEGYDQAS
jgi:hypothetical protein